MYKFQKKFVRVFFFGDDIDTGMYTGMNTA